ncbi:phosphotriesterase [Methylomonas sp. LW13]|uniref:Imm26 family immunity protein n=1 Tax=unclassified Methylomonas TaxID=2608980 RepID=UPI00051C7FC2|nr:Imm26 family immunity protein [Methylomonas sp. LW13]QBC29431.1 phosphotriesterase [Methylomonas sp. LW13]
MSEIKIRGWGAKPRTMLRYIKSGDIFMFQVDDNRYGIGRILIKIDFGHLAEVFDEILHSTELSEEIIRHLKRVNSPIILDSYGLFDKKLEGDWRIVAQQDGFQMPKSDNAYFCYGATNSWKKIDVFGNEESITENEANKLPKYSPKGDRDVKEMLRIAF